MLLYPRHFAGFPLLLFCAGSALPRAVLPAILSTIISLCAEYFISDPYLDHIFVHPYPYQIYATVLGFSVVFRLSQAYSRYWEGLGHVRTMHAKWGDAALEVLSFDCHCKPGATPDGTPEEETLPGTRRLFYATIAHKFSLLHALACGHLRREVKLREMPDAEIDRQRKGFELKRPIKSAARPLGSCTSTFIKSLCPDRKYEDHLEAQPLYVLGSITDRERIQYERLDSETRVNAAMASLMASINARRSAGGMWVDPPAVSRIHQVLTDGMLGFQQACKIEDAPMPFAYSQMVSFTMFIFMLSFPIMAASKASGETEYGRAYWLAPGLTFIAVMTYFLIHEVARELEDPFLHQPNEAPLAHTQHMFNNRLLATWEILEGLYDPNEPPALCGLVGLNSVPSQKLVDTWSSQQRTSVYGNALEIVAEDHDKSLLRGSKHQSTRRPMLAWTATVQQVS